MIYAVTLCYCEPAVLGASLGQLLRTCNRIPDKWFFVPHSYPIETADHYTCVKNLSRCIPGSEIINPEKNLGGTGGLNWAMKEIGITDRDLLLTYDPDSFPVDRDWLDAMIDVMHADSSIATLSLWAPHEMSGKNDWSEETIAGHKVRLFPHPEAFSVTMWRGSFALPEIKGEHPYYGQVESPAFDKAVALGMRNAWLADFKEIPCPIPHDPRLEEWKRLHVKGEFNENFDQFLARS